MKDIPFSVPQGSCAGPVLYNIYSSMMGKLTHSYLVNLLGYADEKTLYNTFNLNSKGDEDSKNQNMENCLSGIAEWTHENRLKLNNEKTEFIVFTSEGQGHKVTSIEIGIDGIKVSAADDIKYVGMWLDYSLTQKKQAAAVYSKVSRNIALIRRKRKYLSMESCQKLASGLVMGLLDYGNALYYGLPNKEVIKLQRLQNYAAKSILGRNKYDSSKLARKQLHWLPVEERIKYKVLTLAYKHHGICKNCFNMKN